MEPYHSASRDRNPDAAKRDPGPGRGGDHSPDPNAFCPGYDLCPLADDVGGRVGVAPRPVRSSSLLPASFPRGDPSFAHADTLFPRDDPSIPRNDPLFPHVDTSIRRVPATYPFVRTLIRSVPTMIRGVPIMIPAMPTMIQAVWTMIRAVPTS
jgi:hypothetical protein